MFLTGSIVGYFLKDLYSLGNVGDLWYLQEWRFANVLKFCLDLSLHPSILTFQIVHNTSCSKQASKQNFLRRKLRIRTKLCSSRILSEPHREVQRAM